MMGLLTELLLTISNALLVPVIVLLLFLLGVTIVYCGGMVSEFVFRWKRGLALRALVRNLKSGSQRTVDAKDLPVLFGFWAKAFGEPSLDQDKTLDDLQLEAERLLGRLQMGVRLGPILGLAGTLIPLGPALVALSSGDVAALSAKLVVAFTTTVLGLLVGGACFAMHSVRRHWYMQDLSDIEFVMKRVQ